VKGMETIKESRREAHCILCQRKIPPHTINFVSNCGYHYCITCLEKRHGDFFAFIGTQLKKVEGNIQLLQTQQGIFERLKSKITREDLNKVEERMKERAAVDAL
jgi:hypothetical protein